MTEICGDFITIEAISPCVFDNFFFENCVGRVSLLIGVRISAGVLMEDVEGAPEAETFEEWTVPH